MFDAEDAGTERPREMAFLGRLPLLCVVGMDMLQHQGRQTLMHIWVELHTTGRRHLSLSDCAVALFFGNHEKQRPIKIDSKFGKRTTAVAKRNQNQKAKNLTLSDVWFFTALISHSKIISHERWWGRQRVAWSESRANQGIQSRRIQPGGKIRTRDGNEIKKTRSFTLTL